jgi:hypothetical protein
MLAGIMLSPVVEIITQGWHNQSKKSGDDELRSE